MLLLLLTGNYTASSKSINKFRLVCVDQLNEPRKVSLEDSALCCHQRANVTALGSNLCTIVIIITEFTQNRT